MIASKIHAITPQLAILVICFRADVNRSELTSAARLARLKNALPHASCSCMVTVAQHYNLARSAGNCSQHCIVITPESCMARPCCNRPPDLFEGSANQDECQNPIPVRASFAFQNGSPARGVLQHSRKSMRPHQERILEHLYF